MGRMKEGDKNIDCSRKFMKFIKNGSEFNWEVMKFTKKGSDFSREVLKFRKKVVKRLGVLGMVVEKCSFYDVFLKVVFKKHVNYNEKSLFVISEKKKKTTQLIASELNSFEKVRMSIYIYIYIYKRSAHNLLCAGPGILQPCHA